MGQRYIMSTSKDFMIEEDYDVIILGTGIAGLFTALNIDHRFRVLLVTKTTMGINNSSLAQGGIATSKDAKIHYEDTIHAGVNHNNKEAVEILTTESEEAIEKLMGYGVNFDRDEKGNLLYTREGGHKQQNILHVKDETGKEISNTLVKAVMSRENIVIKEDTFILDVLTSQEAVKGVMALNPNGEYSVFTGKAVIIVTGGVGQLYGKTTNEKVTTADGIAMAYRAGAKVKDMEFIQFHPTAFYEPNSQQRFLISEAVRGEGAILRNVDGEAFMEKYHEMKDLAPRDIVARALFKEMTKSNSDHVYLDITHLEKDYVKNRFPMIYSKCMSLGIDMTKDWIPVAPAEHYIMGGISTDLYGRTNIKNLYACGECACTGVHGANRLASNSLLEGTVFANRVARDINMNLVDSFDGPSHIGNGMETVDSYTKLSIKTNKNQSKIKHQSIYLNLSQIEKQLKETMNEYVSIVRTKSGLMAAHIITYRILEELSKNSQDNIRYYELINMVTVARLIIKAAYRREASLGAHFLNEEMENKEGIVC
ncbi:L-aspartate oxidase [Alkaliphilus hydrothermalis]|uniref:L-aspartate oxidase n=1 Tax=Alkaliphilus hydrothermalis TaxID=1482730 RepID=A0ABS2NP07_9FIRM|nr:L-aspartate oxidase [Alkaliphilus hydrothermalis]MBM7614675.1 L-aspartate oxidase [Alkaliphilus hydrothermalis]